ncbi:YdeI/OmpD-associated family protein [Chitinophaga filiformis]|uniref:YdeI/OmpD-associated family protein n=1 Tax=Chitinophaga filiformis TaxID=104663 RepID=A0ABY4HV35_CHIFI|nr:YdeI/OmpD-associated family protein [Chitinophaga filiformis]UPK67260.1 YdeI/OmpD-associated family protein [Chitinophaga filiformis]
MNQQSFVESYIAEAEDFAKPVLNHWRNLVKAACPDVIEVIKWGIPHFEYCGSNLCVMASYKAHCAFTFMNAEFMSDPRLKDGKKSKPIKRFLGKITKLSDLPADNEFIAMLREAMRLNENGIKVMREKPVTEKSKTLDVPDYLEAALALHPKAKAIFETKSNSFRKEYIIWITDAKTDETRNKRISEAVEWIGEGKSRFWKHKKADK